MKVLHKWTVPKPVPLSNSKQCPQVALRARSGKKDSETGSSCPKLTFLLVPPQRWVSLPLWRSILSFTFHCPRFHIWLLNSYKNLKFHFPALFSALPVLLAVTATMAAKGGFYCYPSWAYASQGLFKIPSNSKQCFVHVTSFTHSKSFSISFCRVEFKLFPAASCYPYIKFLSSQSDLLVAP